MYEINERDRGSPAYLRLSQKEVNSLGDLVPFSNKASRSSSASSFPCALDLGIDIVFFLCVCVE